MCEVILENNRIRGIEERWLKEEKTMAGGTWNKGRAPQVRDKKKMVQENIKGRGTYI